jgi:hypothetical protein
MHWPCRQVWQASQQTPFWQLVFPAGQAQVLPLHSPSQQIGSGSSPQTVPTLPSSNVHWQVPFAPQNTWCSGRIGQVGKQAPLLWSHASQAAQQVTCLRVKSSYAVHGPFDSSGQTHLPLTQAASPSQQAPDFRDPQTGRSSGQAHWPLTQVSPA